MFQFLVTTSGISVKSSNIAASMTVQEFARDSEITFKFSNKTDSGLTISW